MGIVDSKPKELLAFTVNLSLTTAIRNHILVPARA